MAGSLSFLGLILPASLPCCARSLLLKYWQLGKKLMNVIFVIYSCYCVLSIVLGFVWGKTNQAHILTSKNYCVLEGG